MTVALVTNGDSNDPRIVSGVPYSVRTALLSKAVETIVPVNAFPRRPIRWLVRAATPAPTRELWDQKYVHGSLLTRARSAKRDRALRRNRSVDWVLHVRSWYEPSALPYAAYIDATGRMLNGASKQWTTTGSTTRIRYEAEQKYYLGATAIFCASREACSSLIQSYSINPENVVYVGNGTNLRPAKPRHKRGEARRFLFVGKERERKGLPELLQAFEIAAQLNPDISLTVAGNDAALPAREWLKNAGFVSDRDQLSELYETSDVLCHPARQEAFGLVVPEAMAHGLPCIVTETGELPSMVAGGRAGIVTPTGDVRALTAAILQLANQDISEMSRYAVSSSYSFSWEAIISTIYEEMGKRLDHKFAD